MAEQLVASILDHLVNIAHSKGPVPLNKIAISIPDEMESSAQKSLLDAARIAGYQSDRVVLVRECWAIALRYADQWKIEIDQQPTDRIVVFAEVGHTSSSVSAFAFGPHREPRFLFKRTNNKLGGRNFDKAVFEKIKSDFYDDIDSQQEFTKGQDC